MITLLAGNEDERTLVASHMRESSAIIVACICASFRASAEPTTDLFDALLESDNKAARSAISKGANVKAKNNDGETPLHVAARVGDSLIMQDLVEAGALVDAINELGQTALHLSAAHGHEEEVRELLRLEADSQIRDSLGFLPSDLAAQNEEWAIFDLLVSPDSIVELRGPPRIIAQPRYFASKAALIPMAFLLGAIIVAKGSKNT